MKGTVPKLFTAGTDLTWGARIVVAYDNTIMFYSVPPDVLQTSLCEQKAESWDVYTCPSSSNETRTRNHWLN